MNDVITTMALAAGQAPSIHNSQPWHFLATPDRLEVLTDTSRATPAMDPVGRAMWLACGAAALNAVITARAGGRACSVTTGPQYGRPDLVAVLELGGAVHPSEADVALAESIPLRHTVRTPFEPQRVPAATVARLRTAVESEGAWMAVVDRQEEVIELAVLTEHAEAAEGADPAYRSELHSWLRTADDRRGDGIPVEALRESATVRGSSVPLRTFLRDEELPADPSAPPPSVERPLLVVVATDGDREADWIRAGMAMQRMWLTATADGLAASPMTQALDHVAFRTRLGAIVGLEYGHPQMLLRVGYGDHGVPTSRRPLADTVAS